MVRESKAMAEEEVWSDWNRVEKQNQVDWKKPKRRIHREEWEIRRDFTNNEAIWGRCAFDFDFEEERS